MSSAPLGIQTDKALREAVARGGCEAVFRCALVSSYFPKMTRKKRAQMTALQRTLYQNGEALRGLVLLKHHVRHRARPAAGGLAKTGLVAQEEDEEDDLDARASQP